jgi:hypothetical protein
MLKILPIWRDKVFQSIWIIEDRQKFAKLHRINIPNNYDIKGLELIVHVFIDIFHSEYLLKKLNNEWI